MTKKIAILIGLLIIATGFWLFSREFLKESIMKRQQAALMSNPEYVPTGEPISDTEIDSEINGALMMDSEIELKKVDSEF